MSLGEVLARNARQYPEKTALVFEEKALTFGELNSRVNRLAGALARRGVAKGSNVAVLMFNKLEVIESYFACQKLGACPVPVNFRLARAEVEFILGNSECVGILVDSDLEALAIETASSVPAVRFVLSLSGARSGATDDYEAALEIEPDIEPDIVVDDEDLAFLMYTSGTTGRPKGAMLTHQNLMANTINWTLEMEAGHEDVWLSGLPLFHIGGINGVLPFIFTGGTSILTASTNFDAADSLKKIGEYAVTMCYFVPTQWLEICSLPQVSDVDTSRLRKALWGASQAPKSTLELLVSTFPSVGIVNAFGQTEMSSNTCFLKPDDAIRKMGSVGRAAINVEARIVDDAMDDVAVGEIGEIVYRGLTVMKGYFRNQEATDEAFAGGWFHSGDLVRADEDGFITVVDRKKDMIISGGENIYPVEVERVLEQHPGVAEVTVIGVPHPRWVETPVAVVVPRGDAPSEEEVIAFAKERMASYKKPSGVVFVDALPRNAAGKILRRELRDEYANLFSGGNE
jgi:fatty-acyl-CoA synthase